MVSLPKLGKWDIAAIAALIVFVIVVSIPLYADKGDCEVARAAYKCASVKTVLIENCDYWGKYSCDTTADLSLKQIEWYIRNLCELQNKRHNAGLDCSDLKQVCNQITGKQLCSAV